MSEADRHLTNPVRRFGVFELNTYTGELTKYGARIKLADQPFRILVALLERPGELVTREQLRERIWPGDGAGDFEQGLNRAVSKLRDSLSDRAVNPRFIETLPGRGYRFIGTLQGDRQEPLKPQPQKRRFVLIPLAGLLLLIFVVGAAKLIVPSPIAPLRWRKLTTDSYVKTPPALSDGTRVYFSAAFEGEQFIAQVPISGGHPSRLAITPPAPVFALHDLSADGQELLLTASARHDRLNFMPLWTLRIADGSARRLGDISATSAAYDPSGSMTAYSTPTEVWIALADGSRPRRVVELKESLIGSICWSPDGTRIRFSRADPLSNYALPWEIKTDGSGLKNLSPAYSGVSLFPDGWALDGQMAIFFGGGSFWGRSEKLLPVHWNSRPLERLAEDAPEFEGSIRVRNRNLFHAVGTDRLGELQRFDMFRRVWVPVLEGISADAVEYSPDGTRVAYITYPQGALWVRQADGGRPIQLTSQPLVASNPRWSPDGKTIAFSACEPGDKPVRLYLVDPDGGRIRPAAPSAPGSQGYPTWSPDGKTLLYGIVKTSAQEEVYIRVADLGTGKVTKLAGSEGLFAPRWSPDGRIIAAPRCIGDRTLMLLRVGDKQWQEVSSQPLEWPAWMPDSKSILCWKENHIVKYTIGSGKFETLTSMNAEEAGGRSRWMGVSADGSPLRMLNRDSRQIYSLQIGDR